MSETQHQLTAADVKQGDILTTYDELYTFETSEGLSVLYTEGEKFTPRFSTAVPSLKMLPVVAVERVRIAKTPALVPMVLFNGQTHCVGMHNNTFKKLS